MQQILDVIDRYGGVVSRTELIANGVDARIVDLAAWYRRSIVRVRFGWYARPGERIDVMRAWRVGGRLTCASALAFHGEESPAAVLHVEVPANAARFRDPDDWRKRLDKDAAVVLHWARHPGPGTRRAVTPDHARRVADRCYAAADSACASRMV